MCLGNVYDMCKFFSYSYAYASDTEAAFLDLNLSIHNDIFSFIFHREQY